MYKYSIMKNLYTEKSIVCGHKRLFCPARCNYIKKLFSHKINILKNLYMIGMSLNKVLNH